MSIATASIAAQPVIENDGPLSAWWLRTVVIVMIIGFAGLILITTLSYQNAPPIPARVVSLQGAALFTADDVGEGQAASRLTPGSRFRGLVCLRPWATPMNCSIGLLAQGHPIHQQRSGVDGP
ncbi:hypothetical protein WG899_16845 [Paucibacter sp. AS339]|uniref:hypothetical protein n=1 Tax=Paucibacter hankyongi TaxID=3133434 RepID=UPI0030ADDDB1